MHQRYANMHMFGLHVSPSTSYVTTLRFLVYFEMETLDHMNSNSITQLLLIIDGNFINIYAVLALVYFCNTR